MTEYNANSIQHLDGLEAIRVRPGMYIGTPDTTGWHHCLWEVVDNSVDEYLGGFATRIDVTLNEDNSVTVTDDGRGIPVDKHETGVPAIQVVFTNTHAGGKFNGDTYKISGGLHGVGIKAVNAMSEWVVAESRKGGSLYRIKFGEVKTKVKGKDKLLLGQVVEPLSAVKKIPKSDTGTTVTFQLQRTEFSASEWDRDLVLRHLKDLAFLNPGLKINLSDLRDPEDIFNETIFSPDGTVGLLQEIGESRIGRIEEKRGGGTGKFAAALDPATPVLLEGMFDDGIQSWSVCMNWFPDSQTEVVSFANSIRTKDGGVHVDGALRPLARTLTNWARQDHIGKIKKNISLSATDVRSGLGAVVSVKLTDPSFEGQTKSKLNTQGVSEVVQAGVSAGFREWLDRNPSEGMKIVESALRAHKVRSAIESAEKKAQEEADAATDIPDTKKAIIVSKIIDCEVHDPEKSEIYIVEGDSAADPAINARDAQYQAILPLRGVPRNGKTSDRAKFLANEEIQMILMALGCGYGKNFDKSKLRFKRIIALTDADYDGFHIAALLMANIWVLAPELIMDGHFYEANTPLYSLSIDNQDVYAYSDEERDELTEKYQAKGRKVTLSSWDRFKGLGEMDPDDLRKTAFDPKTRWLNQAYSPEEDDPELIDLAVTRLVGKDPEARKQFVSEIEIDEEILLG